MVRVGLHLCQGAGKVAAGSMVKHWGRNCDVCSAGAMDDTTAAWLHEEGLPYFTMFGQGTNPYKDLKGMHTQSHHKARHGLVLQCTSSLTERSSRSCMAVHRLVSLHLPGISGRIACQHSVVQGCESSQILDRQ